MLGGYRLEPQTCLETWKQVARLRESGSLPNFRQTRSSVRTRGRVGVGALRDVGPFNWWYRAVEAESELAAAGFELGERYTKGRGVKPDAAAAASW